MDKKELIIRLYIKVIFLLIAINISTVLSQEIYKSIRVWDPNKAKIRQIQSMGIPLDHSIIRKGLYIDLIISEDEEKIFISGGISYETVIEDLTKYYQSNNIPISQRDFPLGSMQGNYTWSEVNQRYNELKNLYPDIISDKLIIGESIEGNDIWAFKLSDNPNQNENEPEILYTGLTHAREPLSMMNLFYFVQKLSEGYFSGIDQEATYLVNERELWFVPVVNPDGYLYNESVEPSGGGMHRKNRRDTGCGSGTQRGIDLNRNYSFGWGANDSGSSPDPCYATYRGEVPFSEPETQAVRNFIEQREFINVLHYHSYGNMYIHPFGDGSYPEEQDLTIYRGLAQEMSVYNNYNIGTGFETVGYTVNGDALDWSYGEKNIIAYTPEIGSSGQGFWPSSDQVEPICEDQYIPNKIFAFSGASDFVVEGYNLTSEIIDPGSVVGFHLIIKNRGLLESNGPVVVTIESINNFVSINETIKQTDYISSWGSHAFDFELNISEQIAYYSNASLKIIVKDNVSYARQDTIEFSIGTPSSIFSEDFDQGLGQWIVDGEWGLIDDPSFGLFALTDSPDGDYNAEQTSSATLYEAFDFNFFVNPYVSFDAKWDIEEGYDFVSFQALTSENGWVSLEGNYSVPGNGATVQPLGEHGYDGVQLDWINEKIFLDQLNGQVPLSYRFIQNSDELNEGDGFTFDNFKLMGYTQGAFGDFFPDGSVDVFDILGLVDFILVGDDPSVYVSSFCDMNSDGRIDILDLLIIVNLVVGT